MLVHLVKLHWLIISFEFAEDGGFHFLMNHDRVKYTINRSPEIPELSCPPICKLSFWIIDIIESGYLSGEVHRMNRQNRIWIFKFWLQQATNYPIGSFPPTGAPRFWPKFPPFERACVFEIAQAPTTPRKNVNWHVSEAKVYDNLDKTLRILIKNDKTYFNHLNIWPSQHLASKC